MESKENVMFQEMLREPRGAKRRPVGDRVVSCAGRALAGLTTMGVFLRARLRSSLTLIAFVALPAVSAGLNDSGVTTCGDGASTSETICATVSGDGGAFPRQDARYGRDAQAGAGLLTNKIGAGSKGFDFTKIANNGTQPGASALLGSAATDWACTRDNVTGLTWEVKTSSGLRSQLSTYTWYLTVNGSGKGTANGGSCESAGHCDTEKFVADVNAVALCGYTNWRLPTVKELQNIVDFGLFNPTIDPGYFPNTPTANNWWTGTPDAATDTAWFVDFGNGAARRTQLTVGNSVRLVRSAL